MGSVAIFARIMLQRFIEEYADFREAWTYSDSGRGSDLGRQKVVLMWRFNKTFLCAYGFGDVGCTSTITKSGEKFTHIPKSYMTVEANVRRR